MYRFHKSLLYTCCSPLKLAHVCGSKALRISKALSVCECASPCILSLFDALKRFDIHIFICMCALLQLVCVFKTFDICIFLYYSHIQKFALILVLFNFLCLLWKLLLILPVYLLILTFYVKEYGKSNSINLILVFKSWLSQRP